MTYGTPGALLVVISGPSGVGKDAIIEKLKESGDRYCFVVTVTTRSRRQGETEGEPYHFISADRFEEMIKKGELLEWANVYGHLYGTPKQPVKEALTRGQDVILKVDVQGAASIKALLPGAVFIFLAPPSMEELRERLRLRKTESPEALQLRLAAAQKEMKTLPMFDYVVVNPTGHAEEAVAQIAAIIAAEKRRVRPRIISL
ncbi:MAG: guanylate kinase [Chloroflexi bacterium]|nr:guanylate kinase [Chloroflexota bacterium]